MPAPFLPAYPTITRATLRASLLDRLNRAQFWGIPELNAYLAESLTLWQAMARYWRKPVSFSTHPDGGGNPQFFYDLSVEIPSLGYFSTDSQVLSLIEYHLLEPQSGIPTSLVWSGTAMFPQDAYTDAISRRRDRFLLESAGVIGHFSTPTVAAGTTRVVLPSSLLDVRRVSWVDADGGQTVLWRDDEFAANAFRTDWTVDPGTPQTYSVISTQPFTIQLIPAPADIGFLDLLAIDQGAPLDPETGVILGTPDNYAWAIKFGALADLLSQDGPGTDVDRAQYCEQRYLEAVQLCREMPTVINASIGGNTAQLDSVANFDAYRVGWNVATNPYTAPTVLGLAGQTILATSDVPDPANPFSIGLDAVVNCPLPVDDTTSIDITADTADLIIDEAQHLSLFKSGGEEFRASLALHKNFVQKAAMYRQMSGARAPYWPVMARSNQLEFVQRRMFR